MVNNQVQVSCNFVYVYPSLFTYHIMKIVRGGKVSSWLHDLVIRGKTFAIVQQFETPYSKEEKYSLENLCDWRLICENRESFPRTANDLHYTVFLLDQLFPTSMAIYSCITQVVKQNFTRFYWYQLQYLFLISDFKI